MHPKLKNSTLKEIETKVLYNFVDDELYELDDESFSFLSYCTGRNSFSEIGENVFSTERKKPTRLPSLTTR